MKHESVAVRGEDERDVERRGVGEALLDATGHAVRIVLGLDQGQRDVPFEIEDIVGPLGLAARDQPAAHDDAALGGTHLVADLQHLVASRLPQGGRDELGADVAFAECALVHPAGANSWVSTIRAHYSRKPKRRAPAAHPQKMPLPRDSHLWPKAGADKPRSTLRKIGKKPPRNPKNETSGA